jgi:hypothetical protein
MSQDGLSSCGPSMPSRCLRPRTRSDPRLSHVASWFYQMQAAFGPRNSSAEERGEAERGVARQNNPSP